MPRLSLSVGMGAARPGGRGHGARPPVLAQVANLLASAASAIEIDLTWDAQVPASGYEVEQSLDGVTWGAPAAVIPNAYAVTGLDAATAYFFRVRSTASGDPGPWSATATATTSAAGVSPLTDLVAGWELTAGPQQTLASTGVVASGIDLTEHNGPITYDSDGAHFDGVSQFLSHALGGSLPQVDPGVDWMFSFRFQRPDPPSNFLGQMVAMTDPGHPDSLDLEATYSGQTVELGNVLDAKFQVQAGASYDGASPPPLWSNSAPYVYTIARRAATGDVSMWLNETLNHTATTSGAALQSNNSFDVGGSDNDGSYADCTLKYLRYWSGPNAATLAADAAFTAWLANSGNGRTDAELAAYTP